MADKKGIYLQLVIDDKGTATIKNFDKAYAESMNRLKSSTTSASSACTRAFSSISGGIASLRQHWLGLTAATAGLVLATRSLVNAFLEQERADIKLANAMRLSGAYTAENFEQMKRYATQLQMTTKYGDEAIEGVMDLLYTYRLSTEEVKWATRATLDFASAMGMDAQTAARYMGMALKGNIDMLARYLPALKGTVTEELKTMNATEKVTFFMKLMNEQFGGRAQAEMSGYGAKLTWLNNLMGDIKETIVGGIIASFEKQGMTQDRTAESFRNLATVMISGAESITRAILFLGKTIASILSGIEALWLGFLKLDEYAQRAMISIYKLFNAYAKWRGEADYQARTQRDLTEAQEKLVNILKLQEGSYGRLSVAGEVLSADSDAISAAFEQMREDIKGFGTEGPKAVDNVKLSVKQTAAEAEKTGEAIKEAFSGELTAEMKAALDDYYSAQEKVSDRLMELKSTETDYKLYLLDKEIKAYAAAGVEKEKLEELYQRERQKIMEDGIEKQEKQIEKQEDRFSDAAETMRESLRDLFMHASEGDFANFFDSVQRKLQSFLANIAASMAANTVGKALGLGEVVPGMGSLQDLGGLFKSNTAAASDVMPGSPYAGETAAKAAGAAGSMAGGSLGTALGAVSIAASIGFGISEFISSEKEKNEQKRQKRGEDFVKQLNEWMNGEFDSIEQMFMQAGDDLFSGKGLYAARKYAGLGVSEWAYTWQNAMKIVRSESEQAGAVSVGSFRQMQDALMKVKVTSPEAAAEVAKLQEKLNDTFGKTLREDVAEGLLSANDAIKKMMATGLSQLDAQTAVFGDSYNDLMIELNGSITIIDGTTEKLNEMRENLNQLDEEIAALPESLGKAKEALENISYAIRYLINMSQSFVEVQRGMDEVPGIMEDISAAIKAGDWEGAAKGLYKLQNQALETASAFTQLSDALDYLGLQKLAGAMATLSNAFTAITAALVVLKFIADVVQWFKELNQETDLQIDKIELWKKQIEDADIADVISSVTEKLKEWNDIVYRDTFGDIAADMLAFADEFTYAMMELERLLKDGAISYEDYTYAANQAIAAYTAQIEDYFDEILRGFTDLSKTIKRSIKDVEGGRTADDVMADIISTGMEMGSIDFLKDPDKWLDAAGRLHDLILERYDIEKQRIEGLIADQERIKDAYQSVVDTVTDMLLDIQTSGANPESAQNRLSYFGGEADRLRGLIRSETDAGKRAGYQGELASILQQYLAAAEEVYQRPSPQYQQIYDAVVKELGAIKTDAQEKISLADSEIIRLQGELKTLQEQTVAALNSLGATVGTVTTAIENQRDRYLTELGLMRIGIGSVVTNTGETSKKLGDVTRVLSNMEVLFRTRFPVASYWATHATGLDRVPYDNYPAILHKGEAVVRAREVGSGAPVSFTINVSGGGASGRQIAAELEKEIKWGKLGTVIQQRVRKVA